MIFSFVSQSQKRFYFKLLINRNSFIIFVKPFLSMQKTVRWAPSRVLSPIQTLNYKILHRSFICANILLSCLPKKSSEIPLVKKTSHSQLNRFMYLYRSIKFLRSAVNFALPCIYHKIQINVEIFQKPEAKLRSGILYLYKIYISLSLNKCIMYM